MSTEISEDWSSKRYLFDVVWRMETLLLRLQVIAPNARTAAEIADLIHYPKGDKRLDIETITRGKEITQYCQPITIKSR